MEPNNIVAYVLERVRAGASKEAVQEQLLAVGWSEDEVEATYAEALVAIGVPVPEEGARGGYAKRSSTVEIVLNFFSFILLGVVVIALGTLYFAVINKFFPDPLMDQYSYRGVSDAVHYAIAALVIGFPLYYASVRLWFKKFRQDETKMESKLTKWVTYLVLLAASVTIVGDLITAVYTFLQGELTARFFLKALTVLVIAGAIFGFYFLERKKVQYRKDIPRRMFQIFGWVLSGIVLIGIVLGFVVAGSPATERMRGFDEQRAGDLSSLANCISQYTQQYERLPATLTELENESRFSYCAYERDPETMVAYEYSVVTPVHKTTASVAEAEFELCATFSLAADGETYTSGYYYDARDSKWARHEAGRDCDRETVAIQQSVPVVPLSR